MAMFSKRINCGFWFRLASALLFSLWTGSTLGQGFMVKPMKMELRARPGQTVQHVLEIRNTRPERTGTVDVRAMLLDQGANGAWSVIEPEKATADQKHRLASCLDWLRLSSDSVTVPPMEVGKVTLTLAVPRSARGFYGAGLIAQTRPEPKPGTIAIVIRFLIPVLLEVEGPPARTKIDFPEIGMEYVKPKPKSKGGTKVWYRAANTGQTLARVRGNLDILAPAADKWRRVTTASSRERGMIPGVNVLVTESLDRDLPSGKYKLQARLYVNGRPRPPISTVIDYEGNPAIKRIAMDVPLRIDPAVVTIETIPGARRHAMVSVENSGIQRVNIECSIVQPKTLMGVMAGQVKGDDFSCHEWATIAPHKFSLPPARRRNVRVTVAEPEDSKPLASHYAILNVKASYPAGQSAGAGEALVIVTNKRLKPTYRVQGMGISLAREEPDKYTVVARFGNVGDTHVDLACAGALTDASGMTSVLSFELNKEAGLVLPLGTPRFSGAIDFSKTEPGIYVIKATGTFEDKRVSQTLPVRVASGEQGKAVEVIETTAEQKQGAGAATAK